MKKTDKLHALISCLTMSEKRYFKLHAGKHNPSSKQNYLVMFDLMVAMPEYDESKLQKSLSAQGIATDYLAADKNYLYEIVLKTLRSFHESKSIRMTIKEYLINVEILFAKGLHDQCLKLLQRARKYAERFELLPALIEIASWERKIEGPKYDENAIDQKFAEVNVLLEQLQNIYAYHHVYYQISLLHRQEWKVRSNNTLKKIATLMQNPLLNDEGKALTVLAKIRLYEIKAKYSFFTNDINNEYYYNRQIWQLVSDDSGFMQEYPIEYISIYSRYLALCKQVEPDKYRENLLFFRTLPQQIKWYKTEIAAYVFSLSYGSELAWLIDKYEFTAALQLLPDVIEGLTQYGKHLKDDFKMSTYYKISYTYFLNKLYTDSLHHVNIILNEYDEFCRPDIYCFTRLLNLIIHYELNNHRVLQYEIKNTVLFFKKRDKLFSAEDLVLKFMIKLSKPIHPNKSKTIFLQFHEQLSAICEDEEEKRVLNYFDFLAWINSKIDNQEQI